MEYQNELKLSYIYRDLISTDDKISEILEKHGFTNYKLFRRMFAKHFSATPSKVRNGAGQNNCCEAVAMPRN